MTDLDTTKKLLDDYERAMAIYRAWQVEVLKPEHNEKLLQDVAAYTDEDLEYVRAVLCCPRCQTVSKSTNGIMHCRLCGHEWSHRAP